MDIGAILDQVKGELDAIVVEKMQTHQIPPSLMDKVLDGIQSHVREMKAEQYAEALVNAEINLKMMEQELDANQGKEPETNQDIKPVSVTKTGTPEELLKEIGAKGEKENADILSKGHKNK